MNNVFKFKDYIYRTMKTAAIVLLLFQLSKCEIRCNWWWRNNEAIETTDLRLCQSTLNSEFKLRITCPVYATATSNIDIMSKEIIGFRVTNQFETVHNFSLNSTSVCLKLEKVRINKLTDDDNDILSKTNHFLLDSKVFLILFVLRNFDAKCRFKKNVTVAESMVDPSCIDNILNQSQINISYWEADVSACVRNTKITNELLFPADSFRQGQFEGNSFLMGLLTFMNYLYLDTFSGTISSSTITVLEDFKTFPTEAIQLLADKQIERLSLPNNAFTKVDKNDFPKIDTLTYLDLSHCKIKSIHPSSFEGLTALRELNLAGNLLKEFQITPISLKSLKVLYLNKNRIGSHPSAFELKSPLQSMMEMETLDLSDQRIASSCWSSINDLKNLRYLDLGNCSLKSINNELQNLNNLNKLRVLDLSRNNLANVTLSQTSFYGLRNLILLNISFSHLNAINVQSLLFQFKNMEILDASHNDLVNFTNKISIPDWSTNLRSINLSNNAIKSWDKEIIEVPGYISNATDYHKNITIDISRNSITDFNDAMLRDFSKFGFLKIGSNKFDCTSCFLPKFQNWTIRNTERIKDREPYNCWFPKELIGKNVKTVDVSSTDLCRIYIFNWRLKVVLPVASVAVLTAALVIVAYYHRWYIRYFIHLLRSKLNQRKESDVPTFQYDAFVSYCSGDRDWVLHQLIPKMERDDPKVHLCIHERDFELGEMIMNNIIDSIDGSRRSIFVLSDKFVLSQWCQWELQMAQHKLFEDSRDVLLLVKIGNIEKVVLPKTLKHLINTRTYLEWPDEEEGPAAKRLFWSRMKQNIGKCHCMYKSRCYEQEQINN